MEFFRFFLRESGPTGRRVGFVTLLGGLVSGLMVTIIMGSASAAGSRDESMRYLMLFIVALAAMMTAKRYSLRYTGQLTESIVERLRLRIADKIRRSELLFFENTGSAQFMSLLTKETQTISSTVSMAINASASAVMLIVSFLFIAYLSMPAFLLTLGAIACAVLAYRWSLKSAEPMLQETLATENTFFGMIDHVLNGFKELKVDARKNRDLFENHVRPLASKVTQLRVETNNRFVTTTLITHTAFYGLLGVIIFLLPKMVSCDTSIVVKISTVILFIFGPLAEVVGVVPYIARATVAMQAIDRMEKSLDAELSQMAPIDYAQDPAPIAVKEIEVRNVVFSYKNPDGTPAYTVGPLSLKVHAGEILYIQGGNGSGKSTLLKLLTGLYQPDSGSILVNGQPIVASQYHRYRNIFSIIFTDFHLFDRLYGLEQIDEVQLARLLHEMDLASKTSYFEGRFSHLNLSTGQRKRLSLIISLLEGKSVLVFDEWAADQDPPFRKHFYEVILPELKRQGKTIIAATHDDRYFHTADRVLKMEYGHFVNAEGEAK